MHFRTRGRLRLPATGPVPAKLSGILPSMHVLIRQGLLLLPVVLVAGIVDALINGVSLEHASAILIGTLLAWIWPWWP